MYQHNISNVVFFIDRWKFCPCADLLSAAKIFWYGTYCVTTGLPEDQLSSVFAIIFQL